MLQAVLKQLMQRSWPLALLAMPAMGQPVSVGVRGGIHLVDWFKGVKGVPNVEVTDASSKGAVGPFVSVKLPARLALQAEGLRRSYGFTRGASGVGVFRSYQESGTAWDIPVLLMWRPDYEENGWQPYLGTGPGMRRVTANYVDITRRPQNPSAPEAHTQGSRNTTQAGVMVSAGMERRLGWIVLSTELRYGYWVAPKLLGDVVSNRNQVSVLVGIRTP
jgi:hypothetical protein